MPFNMIKRERVRMPCNILRLRFIVADRGSVRFQFNVLRLSFDMLIMPFNITEMEMVRMWCRMLREWFNMHDSCKRDGKIGDREKNGGKDRCKIDIERGNTYLKRLID